MTLKQIFKLALNRIGEHEGDRQIENLIMNGINTAYKLIAVNNKKSKKATITVEANTLYTLPQDFISLVMLIKEGIGGGILAKNEYVLESDQLLITNPDMIGELDMIYNFIPTELSLATDGTTIPNVLPAYHSAMAAYAAYYYYNLKGNSNAANQCLNEFNTILGISDKTAINENTRLSEMQPIK